MKQPYLKSLSFRLIALFILISAAFLVNSCRKDTVSAKKGSAVSVITDHQLDINQLKIAYNKGITNQKKTNDISQERLAAMVGTLNVDWSNYTVIQYPDSSTVVEFAMPDDTSLYVTGDQHLVNTNQYHNKTNALFILHKDTLAMSFFMKTLEKPADSTYQSSIDQLHYTVIPASFSGQVLYFTLDRQYINGFAWQNGNLSGTVALSGLITQQTQQHGKQKTNEYTEITCTTETVYNVTTVVTNNPLVGSNPNTAQYQGTTTSYVYTPVSTTTTCTSVDYGALDGGGGSDGGGSSGGTTGGVAGGGTTGSGTVTKSPCPTSTLDYAKGQTTMSVAGCPVVTQPAKIPSSVQNITNSVKNPCLAGLINQLINNNTIQTDVTNIFRNTFAVSDQINITFIDGDYTKDPSVGQGAAGTDGLSFNNFEVKINTPIVANASKEYLMETVMHEIFHAYLYANPSVKGNLTQHTYMIQNYVNTEVTTLRLIFPTFTVHDAQCLVLSGYGDLDQTTLNAAIAIYGLTLNDVVNTNNSFKSGTKGTKC